MTSQRLHVILKLDTTRAVEAMTRLAQDMSKFEQAMTRLARTFEHQIRSGCFGPANTRILNHLTETPTRTLMHTRYAHRRKARRRRNRR